MPHEKHPSQTPGSTEVPAPRELTFTYGAIPERSSKDAEMSDFDWYSKLITTTTTDFLAEEYGSHELSLKSKLKGVITTVEHYFATDSELTPEKAVEMVDLLARMHSATVYSGYTITSTTVGAGILPQLLALPQATLAAMRQLPKDERGTLDMIATACEENIDMLCKYASSAGRIEQQNKKAKLQGYENIQEKHADIIAGKIQNDGLQTLDVLLDSTSELQPDTEPTKTKDVMLACMEAIDLPAELSEVIASAVLARCYEQSEADGDKERLKPQYPQAILTKLADRVKDMGVNTIMRLHKECGIVNFADTTYVMLERMVKFIDRDPELMERLQNHEVCVVIKDGSNDHNGAFIHDDSIFETVDEATLLFEVYRSNSGNDEAQQITSMGDLLADRDIHPSLVVYGAHGNRGYMNMGWVTVGAKGKHAFSDTGLMRIIQAMKPDRDGNCSIFINSCLQDAAIDGDKDNTMLTQIAAELQQENKASAGNGVAPRTYMLYGVEQSYSFYREWSEGVFVASSAEINVTGTPNSETEVPQREETYIERVIVTDEGNVYRDLQTKLPDSRTKGAGISTEPLPKTLQLPMYQRDAKFM
mgnify:CR=1 FL=1